MMMRDALKIVCHVQELACNDYVQSDHHPHRIHSHTINENGMYMKHTVHGPVPGIACLNPQATTKCVLQNCSSSIVKKERQTDRQRTS